MRGLGAGGPRSLQHRPTVIRRNPRAFVVQAGPGGFIQSRGTIYSLAATGASLLASPSPVRTGQYVSGDYSANEAFLTFDTSAVRGTILSARLSIALAGDYSTTDFTIEARVRDWGATLEEGDWVANLDLGALPLAATKATLGFVPGPMTENGTVLRDSINQAGSTRFVVCSDRHRTGTPPTQNEVVDLTSTSTLTVTVE